MNHSTNTPVWAKDMQKLAPGFYLNSGKVHISESEVAKFLGVRPGARGVIEEYIQKTLAELKKARSS